jgi:hypothetical protein
MINLVLSSPGGQGAARGSQVIENEKKAER